MNNIGSAKELFRNVYPFATEMITGYMPKLEVKDKSVLTVGSSCDQVFNAMVEGAKDITLFDINSNVRDFYKLKRDIVLLVDREELFFAVMKINEIPLSRDVLELSVLQKMNNYMANDYNYDKLRECLKNYSVKFIEGDIFNFDAAVGDTKYDRIIFSNILQYLLMHTKENEPYDFLKENFNVWKEHLNEDGILQLLYIYSCGEPSFDKMKSGAWGYDLGRIVKTLKGDSLEFS